MTPPFERRRAEDVYKVVEDEVFPRLKVIDGEISDLRKGVNRLALEGCAHRAGDLLRTQVVEESLGRIFEKIDDFGKTLTAHQLKVTEQIGEIKTDMTGKDGGIRTWILGGVIVVLLGLLIYFARDYAHDIEVIAGKYPPAVTQPKK